VSFSELPDQRARWTPRLRGWHRSGFWLADWGPKPNETGCCVPREVLQAVG